MPTCDGCGAHLTERYVRVFGVEGDVPACIHCSTNRDAREAAVGGGGDT